MKLLPIITAFSMPILAFCAQKSDKPNVVLIYADDLGYGDLSCYNENSKLNTKNIDKLASNGLMFTDAHASSSISSPSRYSILTGRYSWRSDRKRGNPAPGEQPWIEKDRLTIASMLKNEGYNTAAIGKWGLGADWNNAAREGRKGIDVTPKGIDYSKPIPAGGAVGFTYDALHYWFGAKSYKTHYACHDDKDAAEKADGARWYFENGISQGGNPIFENFNMEDAQMHYIDKVVEYIAVNGGQGENKNFNLDKNEPFFVYYAPHIPHYPHVPAKQFQNKSKVGLYGDFIYELDWAVGRIIDKLKETDQLDNTLIIFASDNGPELQTYKYIDRFDHKSMGNQRGVKRDLYEGGHRTPFIVSYTGMAKKGEKTDRLVSQSDILATIADYVGIKYDTKYAEDSFSFIDEICPEKTVKKKRTMAIHHSAEGKLALRDKNWVFIYDKKGSCTQEPEWYRERIGAKNLGTEFELFNIAEDPMQTKNVIKENPEIANNMRNMLFKYIYEGNTARM